MGDGKTKPTEHAVAAFLAAVEPPAKRADGEVLEALFRKVTGEAPRMWGPSIVGYGEYNTVYDSGRKVSCARVGFSPRKAKHSLYIECKCGDAASDSEYEALLGKLGKHAQGQGGCLYVNKLADIDLGVLEQMVALGWKTSFVRYPD
ncbi:MAG: hypothetical protein B7Z08_05975 [Sphingomonadales bacterium 32-68-7]|nr:MAG: hypothetical protein B7Z33_11225 [Sphingomonadales bacterium 12-68-11]OYX09287.1 MAG: hypothetical protein B7Z08_05975 [Sphingomonadales bacterium 32-68-7]